jgi:hypothetical protein
MWCDVMRAKSASGLLNTRAKHEIYFFLLSFSPDSTTELEYLNAGQCCVLSSFEGHAVGIAGSACSLIASGN